MANRYWRGGTGSWHDTAHWSASSGGVGGQSVPTTSDNVFFDSNSFSGTGQIVTLPWDGQTTDQAECASITFSGIPANTTMFIQGLKYGVPYSHTKYGLHFYGNCTLHQNLTIDVDTDIDVEYLAGYPKVGGGTCTISQNGSQIAGDIRTRLCDEDKGVGHKWLLGSDFSTAGWGALRIESDFDTQGYAITGRYLDLNKGVVHLRNSKITLGQIIEVDKASYVFCGSSEIIFDTEFIEETQNDRYITIELDDDTFYTGWDVLSEELILNKITILERSDKASIDGHISVSSRASGGILRINNFAADLGDSDPTDFGIYASSALDGTIYFDRFKFIAQGEIYFDGNISIFNPTIRGYSSSKKLRIYNPWETFSLTKE